MQIKNNFNRFSSPQFGMALKLNKGAQEYLRDQSMDTLKKLAQAGKDMADFKYWDLEVHEKGLRVSSKYNITAYANPTLSTKPDPNLFKSFTYFNINAAYDSSSVFPKGSVWPITIKTGSNEKATKMYNEFSKLDYVDKNIELTKLLEAIDTQNAAEEAAKNDATSQAKNNFISDLFEKFGNK